MALPEGHPVVAPRRIGVLLVNLGTPDSPSTADVRKYLDEFLMDGRVIDKPVVLRAALVKGIIVPFRSPKSAKLYKEIWSDTTGSPLLYYSIRQTELLQERLGEEAVNRALSRFVDRFRFKGAPYLRSLDLIAEFRKEAKTPEQQQLITDLFERITLYDLKVADATTRKTGNDWTTTLTVAADKYYADGKGEETKARLDEPIEVGLFTARPGIGEFSRENVIVMGRERLHDGSQRITLKSKAKPAFAGVDPYNFYVDRNSDDNIRQVDAG